MADRARERLAGHHKERKKLDNEAEFYAKREMPDRLKRAFEANAALIRSEQKIIDDVRADMERVNARFDAELSRWRHLVSSGAQPVQRSSSTTQ